jgi:transcriptional regulator with XRE-family HTH domain
MNIPLKIAILETGLPQYVIAQRARIHPSELSRIVRGHRKPRPIERQRLAAAIGRGVDDLFGVRLGAPRQSN